MAEIQQTALDESTPVSTASHRTPVLARNPLSRRGWPFVAVSALVIVWLRVVEHTTAHWNANEQYSYGWAVPFLCLFLTWKALADRWYAGHPPSHEATEDSHDAATGLPVRNIIKLFAFGSLILFLGARWIGDANPDWRLVSCVMAIAAIGFTLCVVRLTWGAHLARRLAFPLSFFLVSVPWPTPIEHPFIQTLTRGIVRVTTELLHLLGIAAIPNGNIIETAGGVVDVDEACSGIRSLQAALMLSLFFGEMRRLNIARRCTLCGLAILVACIFNLVRTFILSYAASQHGSAGVHKWHDPAGIAILFGCFAGVWALSILLARNTVPSSHRPVEAQRRSSVALREGGPPLTPHASPLTSVLAVTLLLLGEIFIYAWYSSASKQPVVQWTAVLPTNNLTFVNVQLSPSAARTLRCNESRNGKWQDGDGTRWQMFYLHWFPGRTAVHLARSHTPEICLPAAGRKLHGISDTTITAHGLNFPFRCYVTGEGLRRMYVFYTLWEDGASEQAVTTRRLDRGTRMEAVFQRRRNPGQRVIQIALTGARDQAHAVQLLRSELPGLIRTTRP